MNLNIVQLDRSLPDGVVVTCHWIASLTDGDYTASSYGAEGFNQKSPDDPDFIAYEDLTPEIVTGWVLDKIGADIEAGLQAQIEAQKNPTSAKGLPWAESQPEA
jgi:hypothetical protein